MIHYFIAYLGLNFNYMYHIINSRNMRKNIFILVCLIIVHVQKIEEKINSLLEIMQPLIFKLLQDNLIIFKFV
jgi:hypothetical protein